MAFRLTFKAMGVRLRQAVLDLPAVELALDRAISNATGNLQRRLAARPSRDSRQPLDAT